MNALQSKVLGLLKDIDAFCRKHEIEYYLTAGTLLGAIRHKGFIPWDDDADVIMTRNNWEKFRECMKNELPDGFSLNSQYDNPNMATTANHYVDTTTTAIYRYDITNPERNGIMIDVIIMDPVPDTEEAKREYVEALTAYTELTTLPYQYSLRIGKDTHFGRNWKRQNSVGMRRTLDEISKTAFNYTEEESQLYVQRFAGSPHFWKKEYFGKPKYVPFEDTMLPVPRHAGECISIGFDDDWMYVPQGGPTRSTHEYCVRSLSIPGENIQNDFESRIDKKQVRELYVKRKKIQVSQTDNKFVKAMNGYRFAAEYVRLYYKKKFAREGFEQYLEQRDFDALEKYFDVYIKYQCSNHFVGSSALEGWINWYRKCNPCLIDIGDDALYAVMELMMYRQRLSRVSKLLKARKAIDRPLSDKLLGIEKIYASIRQALDAYECEEYGKCRGILDDNAEKLPTNPYLWKLDLKLAEREGATAEQLLERTDKGLELFPEDAEISFVRAKACFDLERYEEMYELLVRLIETTNNGMVLTAIRELAEGLIKKYPREAQLYALWLNVRQALGEEELPTLESIVEGPEDKTVEEKAPGSQTAPSGGAVGDEGAARENNEAVLSSIDTRFRELINKYPARQELASLWQDIRSAFGEEGLPDGALPSDAAEDGEELVLTDVQSKRLELLRELKKICDAKNIRYYLFGKGVLQAARNGRFSDENGKLTVVMTADNCRKFIDAVKAEGRGDRYLDHMADNPDFHRFCVRYGDVDTLEFETGQCVNRNCGIYITIEILRNPAQGKLRNRIDQMLEAGWETRNTMKWTSVKRKISYFTVCVLCALFGEKRTGKWLFDRFMKGSKKKNAGRYYLKPFWGKRKHYDAYWFKYVQNVTLEGTEFTTIKPYELYLEATFGKKWKTRNFPVTKYNQFTQITDASVSSREYLAHLAENGIDIGEVWKHSQMTDRKYAPVVTMGASTSKHWEIMSMCGERWRLLEEYEPRKLYIKELFRSNKTTELMEVLDDYYKTAMQYARKGYGICFDRQIFEILEYSLKLKGKGKDAAAIRRNIVKEDWAPICLDERYKEGTMRAATANDVPAILEYLRRSISDCLYMYIDIAKYSLDNPNMKVWVSSNDVGIDLVVMKYHTSISVYSDIQNWDINAVTEIIGQERPLSITAPKVIAEKLYEKISDRYNAEYGAVFEFTKFRQMDYEGEIETASPEDTPEIARLIAMDEGIGSYYDVDNLARQLAERMETGMGRSYIIRGEDGKIIAHIASYAEFDKLATTGGLIVHPDHQDGVIGTVLESYLVENLLKEDFNVYTFVTARLRKKLLTAVGNKCVGEYGKLMAKSENGE